MIAFGVVEIFLSQIPDFDQLWWLSIVAAVMSFTYSTAGLGLGIAKVAGLISLPFLCFLSLSMSLSKHKINMAELKLTLNSFLNDQKMVNSAVV